MYDFRLIVIALVVLTAAACDVSQQLPVTVVVYPSTARCTVIQNDQEQPVQCAQLGVHLRDVLKIAADRQIDVSLPGSEAVTKEDKSIDLIADRIRAAGYSNVRSVRFGL
jgi:hypothetical protein